VSGQSQGSPVFVVSAVLAVHPDDECRVSIVAAVAVVAVAYLLYKRFSK
jgi:hypothetical protein